MMDMPQQAQPSHAPLHVEATQECAARVDAILALLRSTPHDANDNSVHVLAIDGRCGSGKTTLAAALATALDADVIHMDDFFLPPALRTPQRLATPGGNFDCARFCAEVLPHIHQNAPFAYQRFDCAQGALAELRPIAKAPCAWRIVEGAYCHHPSLGDYAQCRVFVDVSPDEQLARITARGGAQKAEQFRTRWIPLEEAYLSAFDIAAHADLCL